MSSIYKGIANEEKKKNIVEGAPELLKQEMPLVRHIEKELEQHGYMKGTAEYDEQFKHAIAFYRQFGNIHAIKQGVKESEKIKGVDGKACWKGYRYAGTQKKGGKTVDKCVKVNENENEYDINAISATVATLGKKHGSTNQILRAPEKSFKNKWSDLDDDSIDYLVDIYLNAISNVHKKTRDEDHDAWREKTAARRDGRHYHEIAEDLPSTDITESRSTDIMGLIGSRGIGSLPQVDKIIDIHSQRDGMSALIRTADGNAYEVQIRQAEHAQHPSIIKKTLPKKERTESAIAKGLQK